MDGQPRVACVTPARRVAGRSVTTFAGLADDVRERWQAAFTACGASQCGFCTPGILVRLEGVRSRGTPAEDTGVVERALAAHLCRCTGWRTIMDAWELAASQTPVSELGMAGRDAAATGRRATLEGGAVQRVAPDVAGGDGGFADDLAPSDALVAVADGQGGWVVDETVEAARKRAGKVQGRRTSIAGEPPLAVPDGDWSVVLRTSWVEPAYLETDASWCRPGGEPATALANGGAFGAKLDTPVAEVARSLADEHGRPVRVLLAREDSVRLGAKRPPVAAGVRADGTGVVHVARTPGIAASIASVAPGLEVRELDLPGPPTSASLRAAGWAEAAVLVAAATGERAIRAPGGGTAAASIDEDGTIRLSVAAGDPLDEVVLRSYCTGAAHMALGWVTSESLAVDEDGTVHDLTIRSFGVPRALDTPAIDVTIDPGLGAVEGPALAVSDAAFAATALAIWRHQGLPTAWPTGTPLRARG